MRIPAGIGDFVRGKYALPQNPVVPGGMGDFVVGAFSVPQTPVGAGIGDLVPGAFSVPETPVGMGYLLSNEALWPVPQNSVIEAFNSGGISYDSGVSGLGCAGGCGGKCKSQCGGCGMQGLGTIQTDLTQFMTDLSSGNIMTALQDPISGIPAFVYLGGAVALVVVLSSMGGKRRR